MSVSRGSLALTLLLLTASVHAAEPRQAGWKVTLDRGPVLELLLITSETADQVTQTVLLRDITTGSAISARDHSDLAWGTSDIEVADGESRLRLRASVDFLKDGLAMPVELRIGDAFYRALWDPPTCPGTAKAKERLMAAASRVPASVSSGITHLLAISADTDFNLVSLNAGLEMLFPDGLPKARIAEKERLTAEQIDALVRQTKK